MCMPADVPTWTLGPSGINASRIVTAGHAYSRVKTGIQGIERSVFSEIHLILSRSPRAEGFIRNTAVCVSSNVRGAVGVAHAI